MTERTSRSHWIGLVLAGLLFLIMIPFLWTDLESLNFLEGHPVSITLWVAFSVFWMLVTCAVLYTLVRLIGWLIGKFFAVKSADSSR